MNLWEAYDKIDEYLKEKLHDQSTSLSQHRALYQNRLVYSF
jgi:hypothetical protein